MWKAHDLLDLIEHGLGMTLRLEGNKIIACFKMFNEKATEEATIKPLGKAKNQVE